MKQFLFIFGILTFGLVTNAQSDGNGPERFYNVESYKANITITYIYSLSEKTPIASKLVNASQTFQHYFTSSPGQISAGDMFQIERGDKEEGKTGNNDSQDGGMLEGVDMDAISKAMKNSGIETIKHKGKEVNVMDQLKKTKRETGSYNMGFEKYKMWMFKGVTEGEPSSSIYSKYSKETKEKQGPCGEVLGTGEDNNYTRYGGEAHADSGGFILQLNLVNNSYSFTTGVNMPLGFKFTGEAHEEDCGFVTNKEISMSARSFISIKSEKDGLIYKNPLPDSGMVLSGSEIITDKFGIGLDKEGANWSVKIDWTISPADR